LKTQLNDLPLLTEEIKQGIISEEATWIVTLKPLSALFEKGQELKSPHLTF